MSKVLCKELVVLCLIRGYCLIITPDLIDYSTKLSYKTTCRMIGCLIWQVLLNATVTDLDITMFALYGTKFSPKRVRIGHWPFHRRIAVPSDEKSWICPCTMQLLNVQWFTCIYISSCGEFIGIGESVKRNICPGLGWVVGIGNVLQGVRRGRVKYVGDGAWHLGRVNTDPVILLEVNAVSLSLV